MAEVVIRKYGGNDAYSWAVFVNGKAVITGLSRREAQYHAKRFLTRFRSN